MKHLKRQQCLFTKICLSHEWNVTDFLRVSVAAFKDELEARIARKAST